MVEHLLAKEKAAGSNPVFRSIHLRPSSLPLWIPAFIGMTWSQSKSGIMPSAASAAIWRCFGVNDSSPAIQRK